MTNLTQEQIKDLRQQYETPPQLFGWCCAQVRQFGIYGFGIDVAASDHNSKCAWMLDKEDDALKNSWGFESIEDPWGQAAWCNPPFGMTKLFLPRAYEQAKDVGVFSAILTQTDPSVKWWVEAEKHATARIDIHPRINFIQHPDYLDYMKEKNIKPSGNPGGNSLWVFNPYDIDRSDGVRVVKAGAWNA